MPTIFSGTRAISKFNRPLYGLHGRYTLSKGLALPYFITSLQIDRAIDDLRIAEEVPPSLDNRWSLRELYQREIDQKRVVHELVDGYLADPKKLKFFNAITVVLMPRSESGQILDQFQPPDEPAPPIPWDGVDIDDAQWQRPDAAATVFGGVQFVRLGDNARLRWAPDTVHAVVVDGQHRVVALREFRDRARAKALNESERQTRIPVIFLLLHPNAGFESPDVGAVSSIRTVARELFTDLNKNAKRVDRARELILDDWNITSLCVRRLVTTETGEDTRPLLPLSLVRWQEPINRFDAGYFLNSLVHLEMLVTSVLDLSFPLNPLDADEVLDFIQSVGESLGDERKELFAGDRGLREVYEKEYVEGGEAQRPMSRLPASFLEAAVDGFARNHQVWLLKVLTEFRPYAILLAYAREHNLICGVFGQFFAQTAKHRQLIKDQQLAVDQYWFRREIDDHVNAIDAMKGAKDDADWSFKTIFQKALVRLVRVVEFEAKGSTHLGGVNDVLNVMNELHERGVLRVGAELAESPYGLYVFIATNPATGMIKVSRGVEDRLLALLTLWYYANRKIVSDPDDPACRSARKVLRHFQGEVNAVRWPRCAKSVELLWKALDNKTLHGSDLSAVPEKQREDTVRRRFASVLEAGIAAPYPRAEGIADAPFDEDDVV